MNADANATSRRAQRARGAIAFLGLGSNLGDRAARIGAALERLAALPGVTSVEASAFYETSPVGGPPQSSFLNAAARVDTTLSPRQLLDACLRIERELGRVRREKNGPREIDVDVLLYGDQVIEKPDLMVPHPAMATRRFVLAPLDQIARDVIHPTELVPIRTLLERLDAAGNDEVVTRRFPDAPRRA